jgi:hypothetical protein
MRQTDLVVEDFERGSDDARDRATDQELGRIDPRAETKPTEDLEAGRIRSEAARDLVRRVDELTSRIGDISLATYIGLLKRDLSRCHDLLKDRATEGTFLSIVTLVESALTQLKWKQYNKAQVETIHKVLDMGYRQVRVGFDDYELARSLLAKGCIDSTPRIDLESLKWDDITNGEEE